MKELREVLRGDLKRIATPSIKALLKHVLLPQRGEAFPWVFWFRIVQITSKNVYMKYTLGLVPYVILCHYEYKYGIHADTTIHVGKGLDIVHGGNVFLNCDRVGNNLKVYPGVMLGSNVRGGVKGRPTVGDNVTIYTGAVVVGSIHLGDGCIIGANAFVNRDVEAHTTVAGVPAKKI